MFKQLKIYYLFVSLPFVFLLTGAAVFFEAIKGTIQRNPHPQINYTIFVIIIFGGLFIILNAHRLVKEARALVEFSAAIRASRGAVALQEIAGRFTGDISYLLQMVAASSGRSISHQEQVAIEHELTNARARLNRRNALPQYLSGLLVGMGLLGTFIGLLATLNDISTLISSFAELDMSNVNPIAIFRIMIERMRAPMQSMAIAFSASMFGLLGSIILGLMMVGIRRLQGDISSLLSSEVARHIELALSKEVIPEKLVGDSLGDTGALAKVLVRIEERLAESLRAQQRVLAAEIDDFRKQREEVLQVLSAQQEASNGLRGELQQLGRQLSDIFVTQEKWSGDLSAQISELTVQMVASVKESNKLLVMQVEEQRRLKDALDACKIEERFAESMRLQQRALTAEVDDFRKQRGDMLQVLTDHTEASNNFRGELQQLGRQLGSIFSKMEKGSDAIVCQLSEMMVHMSADAKESHKLLTMQVNEQSRLRDSLDLRVKSKSPEPESYFAAK